MSFAIPVSPPAPNPAFLDTLRENISLLNTAVDIESEVKGDRLLEFDETKNIKEKFEQFINGDLQARFLFAIREFFVGAFEALGVLGSAAQDSIRAVAIHRIRRQLTPPETRSVNSSVFSVLKKERGQTLRWVPWAYSRSSYQTVTQKRNGPMLPPPADC